MEENFEEICRKRFDFFFLLQVRKYERPFGRWRHLKEFNSFDNFIQQALLTSWIGLRYHCQTFEKYWHLASSLLSFATHCLRALQY